VANAPSENFLSAGGGVERPRAILVAHEGDREWNRYRQFMPGKILTGRVETVLQAISTGQVQASGTAVAPKALEAAPFLVRVNLDDPELGRLLPAGAVGSAAIFTSHIRLSHIVRRVILRQIAIYVSTQGAHFSAGS
jgi:hypothetical protein